MGQHEHWTEHFHDGWLFEETAVDLADYCRPRVVDRRVLYSAHNRNDDKTKDHVCALDIVECRDGDAVVRENSQSTLNILVGDPGGDLTGGFRSQVRRGNCR